MIIERRIRNILGVALIVTKLVFLGLYKYAFSNKFTSHTSTASMKPFAPGSRGFVGRLPLFFEPNRGQFRGDVKYLARGERVDLFLRATDAIIAIRSTDSSSMQAAPRESTLIRLGLKGSQTDATIVSGVTLPGKVNYLARRRKRDQRIVGIPTFGTVAYKSVYPGIDLIYGSQSHQLEYKFVVAPRASVDEIRMVFSSTGIRSRRIDPNGDLHLETYSGDVVEHRPIIYQTEDRTRREIPGRYKVVGNEIHFAVGPYDRERALVIDPTFDYSANFGQSGDASVSVGSNAVAVDSSGNVYVAGSTGNGVTNQVIPGKKKMRPAQSEECALLTGFSECAEAFVYKLDPSGTTMIYQTEIATGEANGIAIDSTGDAYIAGTVDG